MKSMTAFVREDIITDAGLLSLELRSVNHRYLDLSFKITDELRQFEPLMREMITKKLSRGRVEVSLKFDKSQAENAELNLNQSKVQALCNAATQLKALYPSLGELRAIDVLQWRGVLDSNEINLDDLKASLSSLLSGALIKMIEARLKEGSGLFESIHDKCVIIRDSVAQLPAMMPEVELAMRERLQKRVEEIKTAVDESRIEQEIVLYLQKIDVNEEIERLNIHLEEVMSTIQSDKPMGRRLDFLMQELHREANTLSTKAVDMRFRNTALDTKVLIEQMREQVQNVE